jgi:hypothetical protein
MTTPIIDTPPTGSVVGTYPSAVRLVDARPVAATSSCPERDDASSLMMNPNVSTLDFTAGQTVPA